MAHPTSLHKLISQSNEELGTMVTKAKALMRLNGRLRRALGEPLASHCGVANMKSGELVLYADSSAWAAKLRFAATQIREILAAELGPRAADLNVKIRVVPAVQPEDSSVAVPRSISQRGADSIQAAAETVEDPELGEALMRLARHARGEE